MQEVKKKFQKIDHNNPLVLFCAISNLKKILVKKAFIRSAKHNFKYL